MGAADADREGLRRKLTTQLSPEAASLAFPWDIADCTGIYWRPNFDVSMYPYLPAHITRPKEVKKIFLVPLPEKCYLAVRAQLLTITLLPPRLQAWRCLREGNVYYICKSQASPMAIVACDCQPLRALNNLLPSADSQELQDCCCTSL